MRPLNTKETKAARVWRVLQKYNSITQTTSEGKPLPERVTGRTFFTFDKTFGEKSTTREVYNEIAQGIVESVVNGLNGTIFAYGQTSSGKTHTMQGSGTIEDGQGTGGGVVHMAARDIFSLINNDPERVFLLRVSFIEIYNEEVRDLLVSGNDKVLKIREDNTRGVFVDATENIVTDSQSLLSILFAGEKHRAFASTGMNERSSRSHTIFRITVESRRRKQNDAYSDDDSSVDSDDDDDDEGDGAVRVSTLNLVDLAGSESVRHTGATGDRLKEGAKINQR
jgi:centromeric protein E